MTVKKQLRQVRALARFSIRALAKSLREDKEFTVPHQKYVARKEVERASLLRSTNGLSLDSLRARVQAV